MIAEPILVTGATGFLGQHLVGELRRRGLAVRALLRPGRDGSGLEANGTAIVRGDLTDAAQVRRAVEGCGTVFHLGAARGPLKLSRRQYLELNPRYAETVAHGCITAGVNRLVMTSTARIACRDGSGPSDEECPPRPRSGYYESKIRAEEVLLDLRNRGLKVVIARPPGIMGPGAVDWKPDFLKVQSGRLRYLPSGGVTHICDVDDIIQGLYLCATVPNVEGERFILAASEPVRIRDLYRAMADALGVSFSVRELPGSPFRAYAWLAGATYRAIGWPLPYGFTSGKWAARHQFRIDKARALLGFAPRWDMRATVARTATWMREMGWLHE